MHSRRRYRGLCLSVMLAMGSLGAVAGAEGELPPAAGSAYSLGQVSALLPPDTPQAARAAKAELLARQSHVAGKLHGRLLELADQHAQGGQPQAMQFAQANGIPLAGEAVTVIATPKQGVAMPGLEDALVQKGAEVVLCVCDAMKVRVPVNLLLTLARDVEQLECLRLPATPNWDNTVITQGRGLTNSDHWALRNLRGQGIKVAVIDGGFIGLAARQAADEIPATAVQWNYSATPMEASTAHGCGVVEIVYDLAPDALLYLVKIDDEVDLQAAETACVAQGIHVINTSLAWYGFNFFDGAVYASMSSSPVSTANHASANGIVWACSAGNDQRRHCLTGWRDDNANDFLEWAPGVEINRLGTLPAGTSVILTLTWNAWPTTNQDFDLYLFRWNGTNWVAEAGSTSFQTGSQPPAELISVNASVTADYGVAIVRYSATTASTFILRSLRQNVQYFSYGNTTTPALGSLGCPADAASVLTVGAIPASNYLVGPVEPYSSLGPTNGFYTGQPVLTKPDICGPDATASVTYPGGFGGTSASSPHLAGLAALVRQAFPAYTNVQVAGYLQTSGLNPDLGLPGKDNTFGYGPAVLTSTFRTLSLQPNNPSWGTVTANPDQPDPANLNLRSYVTGQQVTATASATGVYRFVSWSGDATGSSSSTSITMDANQTVTAVFTIRSDINRDGLVSVSDLQALVAVWAAGPGYSAAADISGDGYVNVGDLQILIADWGWSNI